MKGVSLPFAMALIVVGGVCFIGGLRIEQSVTSDEDDPGPKALPLVLGGALFLGGVGSCISMLIRPRQEDAPSGKTDAGMAGFGNAPVALSAFVAYVIAIGWLGFQVSTLTFVWSMLVWLGARWWSALLMAVLVIGVVRFVFGNLLYVQLPEGAFGLAI